MSKLKGVLSELKTALSKFKRLMSELFLFVFLHKRMFYRQKSCTFAGK